MRQIKKMTFITDKAGQRGVVLIVALVFLVALTAVAAALMQNSTTDMKMSGATEQKVIAMQDAISAVDEVILTQRQNGFSRPLQGDNFPIADALPAMPSTDAVASVVVANNKYLLDLTCPHTDAEEASEEGIIECNVLTIQVTRNYGRNGNSNVRVSSGISQKLIGVQQ